ncbi:MAG: Asp23/Gls24 family envelope stress response protein [Lachnospiraceae bacterium]|nr:Asp23/Gls24 family envelope stress response protein [Lachnospiraceae bacterium]
MEKETKRNTYVLPGNDELGTVQISDEVVAVIAGLAATEVEGVSAMAGNVTNELMSRVGVKNLAKGVRVEILGQRVKVSLSLMMHYGYNIPTTCGKVQEKVKSTIENMTGLDVTDVNVRIAGVDMNKNK